jgi:hypothetical protein
VTEGDRRGATERVIQAVGQEVLERLTNLSGPDLTTFLLEVFRRRAHEETPTSVLRRHQHDRFVAPVSVPFHLMRATGGVILDALPPGTEVTTLSPLVPLGTHTSVGPVDPRNVIATIRRTEVAADPTNGLSLVAAVRRREALREGRPLERVRLAALQRVVRAQPFEGDAAFAHFEIAGLVTAGRSERHHRFEREVVAEHIAWLVAAFRSVGAHDVHVRVSLAEDGGLGDVLEAARAAAHEHGVEVAEVPDRERGQPYYAGCRFQVYADLDGTSEQIADGGSVDWTQQLVPGRSERLCISGIGVERLALAGASADGPGGGNSRVGRPRVSDPVEGTGPRCRSV